MYQLFIIDIYLIENKKENVEITNEKYIVSNNGSNRLNLSPTLLHHLSI